MEAVPVRTAVTYLRMWSYCSAMMSRLALVVATGVNEDVSLAGLRSPVHDAAEFAAVLAAVLAAMRTAAVWAAKVRPLPRRPAPHGTTTSWPTARAPTTVAVPRRAGRRCGSHYPTPTRRRTPRSNAAGS